MEDGAPDLATLDRDVARARARLERLVPTLATAEGRAAARGQEPFAGVRHVSTQGTFRALREGKGIGQHEELHRDALVRSVYELVQARVGWELAVDEADALFAVDEALPARERERAMEQPRAATEGVLRTWVEAHEALVSSPHRASAETALERLADLAAPVAAVRTERRMRRFEAARRLGLEHPWDLATGASVVDVAATARALLDATEPLAKELQRDAAKRSEKSTPTAALAIHDALARDAREGWPARLASRWLNEVFRALTPRTLTVAKLPDAQGGASFLRAAARWGFALREAQTAPSLPFALARDPYPDGAHRLGCTLALAVASRLFARRALGLSSRDADAHARALGRSLLFTERLCAMRVLVRLRERADRGEFEELGARVFGAPLPAALLDAWPEARTDEPARLVGACAAHGFARELEERFDEDWFANPKTGVHLFATGHGPIAERTAPPPDAAAAIARAWEGTLG